MRSQEQLPDQVCQDRDTEKDQPDLEKRREIKVGRRFGEFIRDHARQRVARLREAMPRFAAYCRSPS